MIYPHWVHDVSHVLILCFIETNSVQDEMVTAYSEYARVTGKGCSFRRAEIQSTNTLIKQSNG